MAQRECPQCGAPARPEDRYCEECGMDISDVEAAQENTLNALPGIDLETQTTRRNAMVGGAYVVGGLTLFGAAAVSSEDDEPTDDSGSGDDDGATDDSAPVDDDGSEPDDGGSESGDGESTQSEDDNSEEGTPENVELEYSDADTLISFQTFDEEWFVGDTDQYSYSGSGQEVTDPFEVPFDGMVGFAYNHEGQSNFIVEVLVEGSDNRTVVINEIGSVTGATAVPAQNNGYIMDVTADGEWEIQLGFPEPPTTMVREPPVSASGSGRDLVGPLHVDGTITATGEHSGESNFIVQFINETADGFGGVQVAFNEIGEFGGETALTLSEWFGWIDVTADGSWSLEIE